VTLSYENSIIRYDGNIKSKLQNKLLNMNFDYSMLKVWNIKADYQYVHNKGSDNSSSLVFNNVNTRITYSPKSKSYDFFVDALNITGNKFQVRNFQNELSTSINQTMILPRQILIGLRYRL
jgi:putative salt-induced outer membrane protein YdiY